ncbi:MAG: hypothetical protein PHW69_09015 [Elusimicrobiaceae bacterium]|nr:hypothetical protein [Elusimicrobiaceae bacterium]
MLQRFKLLAAAALAALALAPAGANGAGPQKPHVTLFYASHCKVCLSLKKEFLPEVRRQYENRVQWRELETDSNESNLALLYIVSKDNGYKDARVPAILIGNSVLLVGKTPIEERLAKEIDAAITAAGKTDQVQAEVGPGQASPVLKGLFAGMSATAVAGAGLVDGINPCAFAVIVFFVSFLAVYGYNRRDIVYIGSAYCLAVFLTYLLLGLGMFKALYALSGFYAAMKIFYYLTAGFCLLLFVLSVYDWTVYAKTGRSEGMLLQLPKNFKVWINRITGALLRGKEGRSPARMLLAAFAVGFVVSLIEAVCTGQVYVPTIVFIMKDPELRVKAVWYLLLYNAMFIAPLVTVFLLSFAGFGSERFNGFLKKHLGLTKILLALVFLALALMLLLNL